MRKDSVAIVILAVLGLPDGPAWSQSYPVKPVRIIVPFPAGGAADIFARLIGRKLGESLGQSFVGDNRAGASGIIGCEAVARSAPDGYTLLMGTTGTHTTNPAVFSRLPYDPIKDFAPLALVADAPFVLVVHPSLPVKNIKDLIQLAKSRPGELSYASSGTGSSSHFGFELFNSMAGIKAMHVPYKGQGPANTDTIAGNITMSWFAISASTPFIKAKRLRALGIGSTKRSTLLPDVPTIAESGLSGFELGSWYAMFAPTATPREITRNLQREVVKAIAAPGMREQFAALGAEPVGSTPEELAAVVQRDLVKWAKVAREANVKAE